MGVLNLAVNTTPQSGSNSVLNHSWTLAAGGHAQAGVHVIIDLPVLPDIDVANVDAQLAAYTQTTGDTLVFGREITTQVEILGGGVDLTSTVQGLVNQVAGASVLYSWQANSTVSGLAIVPDQLYQVSFNVTSGAGLPVNLLSSSSFGITTAGITGASNESVSTLNLLNVVSLGANSSTGQFNYLFKSSDAKSALNFAFAANSVANVSLLGGTAGNQNVLTYSNFQVTAVPEPASLALGGIFLGMLTLRRHRRS